ncbi:MAG: hypothetical protein ACKO7B_20280, partial [Flavobacteriales bacterium]
MAAERTLQFFKTIKKGLRIFIWIISSVVLAAGLFLLALQTESFQTWLAHRLTAYLSKELKAKVSV